MAQNIIYSPWERAESPWLCLMTRLLFFSLLWLFSFVPTFLTFLIKLILDWSFPQAKGRQRTWGVRQGPVCPCSIIKAIYIQSLQFWRLWRLFSLKFACFFVCLFFLVAMCVSWLASPFLHPQSASVQSQHLSLHHLLFADPLCFLLLTPVITFRAHLGNPDYLPISKVLIHSQLPSPFAM